MMTRRSYKEVMKSMMTKRS